MPRRFAVGLQTLFAVSSEIESRLFGKATCTRKISLKNAVDGLERVAGNGRDLLRRRERAGAGSVRFRQSGLQRDY
jgi:hypothetical protein